MTKKKNHQLKRQSLQEPQTGAFWLPSVRFSFFAWALNSSLLISPCITSSIYHSCRGRLWLKGPSFYQGRWQQSLNCQASLCLKEARSPRVNWHLVSAGARIAPPFSSRVLPHYSPESRKLSRANHLRQPNPGGNILPWPHRHLVQCKGRHTGWTGSCFLTDTFFTNTAKQLQLAQIPQQHKARGQCGASRQIPSQSHSCQRDNPQNSDVHL